MYENNYKYIYQIKDTRIKPKLSNDEKEKKRTNTNKSKKHREEKNTKK